MNISSFVSPNFSTKLQTINFSFKYGVRNSCFILINPFGCILSDGFMNFEVGVLTNVSRTDLFTRDTKRYNVQPFFDDIVYNERSFQVGKILE